MASPQGVVVFYDPFRLRLCSLWFTSVWVKGMLWMILHFLLYFSPCCFESRCVFQNLQSSNSWKEHTNTSRTTDRWAESHIRNQDDQILQFKTFRWGSRTAASTDETEVVRFDLYQNFRDRHAALGVLEKKLQMLYNVDKKHMFINIISIF